MATSIDCKALPTNNRPFHATLEGIQLRINEIASFSGVPCEAIFSIKCIELTGFFSVFEASLYRNYVEFSNKSDSIVKSYLHSIRQSKLLARLTFSCKVTVRRRGPTFRLYRENFRITCVLGGRLCR